MFPLLVVTRNLGLLIAPAFGRDIFGLFGLVVLRLEWDLHFIVNRIVWLFGHDTLLG